MKSRIFILLAVFFLFTVLHAAKANAQDSLYSATATAAPIGTATNVPVSSSNNLPINKGIVFLAIAGIIIGIVAVKKYKSVKTSV